MKRFKNILFYADQVNSPGPALERAIALAKRNQARLTVVDVIEGSEALAFFSGHRSSELHDALRQQRKSSLDALIAPYQSQDNLIYTDVLQGKPFIAVIRAILRSSFDLLIKPAREQYGLTGVQLHTTDQHLLRKCPCPVWIDKSNTGDNYQSLLAAVDPSAEPDPYTDRLVMDLATSLAKIENAELSVIHAWEMYGESALHQGWLRVPQQEIDQALTECEATYRQRYDDLLANYQLSTSSPNVHLVKSNPAQAIGQLAEQVSADLIVMGTVGRSGIPGLIIGNTAESVLQSTRASILAVKPDGFVSPVSLEG